MRTRRWAPLLLPALLAMPACTEQQGTVRRSAASSSEPSGAPAAREAATEPALDEASACPDGTSPARLAVAAIDTVMTWCVLSKGDGTRVQHGPWRKERAGRLIESGGYSDGLRHGEWNFHWGSGPLQSSGAYENGRKTGPWTFWAEDGAVIRRVDYEAAPPEADVGLAQGEEPGAEEPGEGETEAATAEAEEEAPEVARVSLSLANAHATDIVFALEPWAEEYDMPPGSTFEISAEGPDAGDLVVESSENAITVWAREGSDVQLWYDGVEVAP